VTELPLQPEIPLPTKADLLALRVVQIGAIAAVLIVLPNPSFELDRFLVPKELVLHITAVIAGLLALRSIRRVSMTRVDWFLLAYLAVSAASAALATNRWLGMRALAVSASGIVLFWTARGLRQAGLERPLLNGLALAVVIAAITSLLQAYGVRIDFFASSRAPGGTLGNRNFVAHVAAFGLPICFLAALRAQRTATYFLASIGVAIVTASLVLSRSRAAWLAFAVMFVIVFIGSLKNWGRLAGVLAFAAAGVGAVLLLPNTLHWRSENPYLESVRGVANYEEGSGRGRLEQYGRSLVVLAHHPLLGAGPGNWPVEYPRYARGSDPSISGSEPGMTINPWPSSDWIGFLTERGLLAAILIALAFIGIAISARDAMLLATLAAAIVAGLFDAVLLLAVPTLIVWTAIGALWSPPTTTTMRPMRALIVLAAVLISAMGAFRCGSQIAAMEMYASGISLERASQIDPGNFRIHMRLARKCAHARAAHALFPNAEAARAASRRCP
jgi:O-antigen ligase